MTTSTRLCNTGLATSGADWVERYKEDPSETYSCQWMVLDLTKFTPGEMPAKDSGLFHVFERVCSV